MVAPWQHLSYDMTKWHFLGTEIWDSGQRYYPFVILEEARHQGATIENDSMAIYQSLSQKLKTEGTSSTSIL